ncbi:KilA-N domain-containing protein [Roseomonas sp. WA12]
MSGAAPKGQLPLPYTLHKVEGEIVSQRKRDGYINATAMCQAAGRRWSHYAENAGTKAFFAELSSAVGIPTAELIQSLTGGIPHLQGTWVHPQVAIHLAQWLSPKFAVMVTKWVYDWMSGGPKPSMPFHLRRYVANSQNVPKGHFSVLNEITLGLIAPMESQGYTLPESLWPDISQGKMFANYMKSVHGVTAEDCLTYPHVFEDKRPTVQARAYPDEFLPAFRKHFVEVWIPQRALDYFKERDPKAIPYLTLLLPPPTSSET